MIKLRLIKWSTLWMALCLLAAGSMWVWMPLARAAAQSIPAFDSVEISLWPEFDKPAMLVIYRANLPADVQFPVSVSLPIPAGVQPNAVAQGSADGRLVDVEYTLETQG